ncbi:MAG: PQQ-binding-like beta-propeller repeat protein [Candidatus Promineifilaceae bacterium]
MSRDYHAPVQNGAPWPTFRRTLRNSGSSPLHAAYQGEKPWFFQTGKGIFSTPVIDADEMIYFGSADHNFYAVDAGGHEKWRFRSGEIIDSAGALPADIAGTVLVPSGDGFLYRLNTTDGREMWRFDAREARRDSYNNWFEGNINIGRDGTIYAGNTNFNYYAISPEGRLKWTYPTGANAWSAAAFGADGTLYWGSCDTFFHAVRAPGRRRWRRRTLGFIAASVAVGLDGTLYAGSFDSQFYALNPQNGKVRWKFKTGDHIYSSAALLESGEETRLIIFGSTDGILYALTPNGEAAWQYDTGAPIRSSPVIGMGGAGEAGHIVYVGNGDGTLFALDAWSGKRRWSFDTTAAGSALADRNDLNGSPALGKHGIYIGGEHGQLWYVPYDYPLHQTGDTRCCIDPGEPLPESVTSLYAVSPGGRISEEMPAQLPAATLICLRLIVREGGRTIQARLQNSPFSRRPDALRIQFDPPIRFRHEVSGDGKYLMIIPEGFLEPGQRYTLTVGGSYYVGGLSIGNLTIGGRPSGTFSRQFVFSTEEPGGKELPLEVSESEVTAFEWTRLAVPVPTMLPSLNQIGFDYLDWLIGTVAAVPAHSENEGKLILWAIGAKRNEAGELKADSETEFKLPLSGSYRDDAFMVRNRHFTLPITGIPIPFHVFELRGRMGQDQQVLPGARAYAETEVLSIPTFGIPMVVAGLANQIWRKLVALATYITRPYERDGKANKKPAGVRVEAFDYAPPTRWRAGSCRATIALEEGQSYRADDHVAAIVLVDRESSEAVYLDYGPNLEQIGDEKGNLRAIRLALPKGMRLPEQLSAYVMLDVFPIYETRLVG